RVLCRDGLRGGQQSGSCFSAVLVQDENGKDVTEEHASSDECDSAEDEQALRAHGGEACRDRPMHDCRCHSVQTTERARPGRLRAAVPTWVVLVCRFCSRLFSTKCGHHVLGEHVLRLDALPMLQPAPKLETIASSPIPPFS